MKTADYWKKRFVQMEQAQHQLGAECYEKIEQRFMEAQRELEKQIRVWYGRFAVNNDISMTEARKLLHSRELEELRWDIREYIKYGEDNAVTGEWMKQLENASAKYHVSRLEALKLHTQQCMEVLYGNELDTVDSAMRDIYRSGYYRTAFEIQKGFGVGWDFASLDERKVAMVVKSPWAADGKNFSQRIWENREKLIRVMDQELTRNIILGQDPQKAIDAIAKQMNTSKTNAGRLVMTEEAFFSSAAQQECFRELDVEEFEIVATLDSHTSELCRKMDGKHFPMSQWEVGTTAPPFHVNCRTTTVPYFADDLGGKTGMRAARNTAGDTYLVPADMTYREWQQSLTDREEKAKSSGLQKPEKNDTVETPEPKPDAYTKEEAVRHLKKEYKIKFKDSQKYPMDERLLSLSVDWLDGFAGRYPAFMKKIKHKLPAIWNLPYSKMKGAVGAFSYYPGSGRVEAIKLNGCYFSDYSYMKGYIESNARSSLTVANAQPHKTFVHEFGHYVAHSIGDMIGKPGWLQGFIRECIMEFKEQVPTYGYDDRSGMKEYVSGYAAKSDDELFAEAFAEYYGGSSPRTFARIFGEKLDGILRGVK